jgi:hypothetical protein
LSNHGGAGGAGERAKRYKSTYTAPMEELLTVTTEVNFVGSGLCRKASQEMLVKP